MTTTKITDETNPAYAVLYTCKADGEWRAEVVDLPGCEAFGDGTGLERNEQRYTVLYSLQPAGNWRAKVVDLPGCEAIGDSVGSAKLAASIAARLGVHGVQRYRKCGDPVPPSVTVCGYVRPGYEFGGLLSNGAMAAATRAVRDYRERSGPLPVPTSVCGYVWPERNDDETEAEDV